MPPTTADYKGLTIFDPPSPNAGAALVMDNFSEIADRIPTCYFAAFDPVANDDEANTGGRGFFYRRSRWINTATNHEYVCTDSGVGAAVWKQTTAVTGTAWGDITGTLANQTDLQTALDGKSATGHSHNHSAINDDESTKHRLINDGGVGATELWSANKIQSELNAITSGLVRRSTVLDYVDSTAAPPTEVSGDRYILDDSGATHANWDGASQLDIVDFNGTTWDASTPDEGWVAYVDAEDQDRLLVDDGVPAWEPRPVAITAHSGLSGLGVDDHAQYHNDTRGDVRYYTKAQTYTQTEIDTALSGKSDTSHLHDGRYYTETETDTLLSGKSDTGHDHDVTYSLLSHDHDADYTPEIPGLTENTNPQDSYYAVVHTGGAYRKVLLSNWPGGGAAAGIYDQTGEYMYSSTAGTGVRIGQLSETRAPGGLMRSNYTFDSGVEGTLQDGVVSLGCLSPGAGWTEFSVEDAVLARLDIPAYHTFLARVRVVASRNDQQNEIAAWMVNFVVSNNGTTTEIVGDILDPHDDATTYTPAQTIPATLVDESFGAWGIRFDTVGTAMRAEAKGETGKNIRFALSLELVDIGNTVTGVGYYSSGGDLPYDLWVEAPAAQPSYTGYYTRSVLAYVDDLWARQSGGTRYEYRQEGDPTHVLIWEDDTPTETWHLGLMSGGSLTTSIDAVVSTDPTPPTIGWVETAITYL